MSAQDNVFDAGHGGAQMLEQRLELLRHRVADGVGDVDRGGAGLDHGGYDLGQKLGFGAGCVFRREFHVVARFTGHSHGLHGPPHDFLAGHFQLELAVNLAGGDEYMDTLACRRLQCARGLLDISLVAARQRADRNSLDGAGNFPHRLEVSGRGRRKARLDDIHAHIPERARNLELLAQRHAAAGRLLAVTQGGVKDAYPILVDLLVHLGSSHQGLCP